MPVAGAIPQQTGSCILFSTWRPLGTDLPFPHESTESAEQKEPEISSDGWYVNTPFGGVDAKAQFDEWLKSDRGHRTGLMLHRDSVNTPEKAMKVAFGAALNLTVRYTNQYGHHKFGEADWIPCTKMK